MSGSTPLTIFGEQKTTGGNYFVANYPPFSFWGPENLPDALAALDRAPGTGVPLGIYVHIPFCRKRCHFCYYKVYTDKNAAEIHAYLDAMIDELRMFADRGFIGGRKPAFIYFGGGTPSYLSAEQLASLTRRMKQILPWDAVEEVTFECEPGTLTENKFHAIREMGVTRLSLGVEHFDDAILKRNGRAHGAREIPRAYGYARRVGFPQINIDLISGMMGETDATWRDCIARTIELQPDSITIYQMEIPFNTTIYHDMKAHGEATAPVADWATKRGWLSYAWEALGRAGYEISSAYTLVKAGAGARFFYRDALWRGADLLGIGVSSFGTINGVHMQNEKDMDAYLSAVSAGRLPLRRAICMSDQERLIRELVLQLKLGHVERAYFRDKFGVDIGERFAGPIRQLQDNGLAVLTVDELRLTREGLLRVDALLPTFFLPEHRS